MVKTGYLFMKQHVTCRRNMMDKKPRSKAGKTKRGQRAERESVHLKRQHRFTFEGDQAHKPGAYGVLTSDEETELFRKLCKLKMLNNADAESFRLFNQAEQEALAKTGETPNTKNSPAHETFTGQVTCRLREGHAHTNCYFSEVLGTAITAGDPEYNYLKASEHYSPACCRCES